MIHHIVLLARDTAIRSLVGTGVGVITGYVFGWSRAMKRVVHEFRDRLDDKTEGGLGELAKLQRETNELLRRR